MLMDLSGISLTALLKSLAALLFPIETDGVKVYTIADCKVLQHLSINEAI